MYSRHNFRRFARPGRYLVACLLAGFISSGVARPARAGDNSDTVVLQLHWYPQAQFAGYLTAQSQGFFREAGLKDVRIEWSTDGKRPLAHLAAGKTHFCTSWLSDAIVQRAAGTPVVLIDQIMSHSAMLLVARSGAGIKQPVDMTGRRVGLWGGAFDVPPKAFFNKYNARPIIVPQSNSIVPFLRGAVDVVSAMHYNEYHQLLEAGLRPEDLTIFRLADFGIDFPEDGLYCTQATRQSRPEVCRAMVASIRRGWQHALANESETLDLLMRHCRRAHVKTNRNHQRWMLRAMSRVVSTDSAGGRLSKQSYQAATRILLGEKLIDKSPAFDAFYQPTLPKGLPK